MILNLPQVMSFHRKPALEEAVEEEVAYWGHLNLETECVLRKGLESGVNYSHNFTVV